MDIHRQIKRSLIGFLSLALLGSVLLVPVFGNTKAIANEQHAQTEVDRKIEHILAKLERSAGGAQGRSASAKKSDIDTLIEKREEQPKFTEEIRKKEQELKNPGCTPQVSLPPLTHICNLSNQFNALQQKKESIRKEIIDLKTKLWYGNRDITELLQKVLDDVKDLYPIVDKLPDLVAKVGSNLQKLKGLPKKLNSYSEKVTKAFSGAGGSDYDRKLRNEWQDLFSKATKKLSEKVGNTQETAQTVSTRSARSARSALPLTPESRSVALPQAGVGSSGAQATVRKTRSLQDSTQTARSDSASSSTHTVKTRKKRDTENKKRDLGNLASNISTLTESLANLFTKIPTPPPLVIPPIHIPPLQLPKLPPIPPLKIEIPSWLKW